VRRDEVPKTHARILRRACGYALANNNKGRDTRAIQGWLSFGIYFAGAVLVLNRSGPLRVRDRKVVPLLGTKSLRCHCPSVKS
jgi:hypothetical protein